MCFALNQGWCSFLHHFDFCSCLLREEIDKNTFENSATFDPYLVVRNSFLFK